MHLLEQVRLCLWAMENMHITFFAQNIQCLQIPQNGQKQTHNISLYVPTSIGPRARRKTR